MATSPIDHVVQHPIAEIEADLGVLTPDGKITVWSDHISMLVLAGLVLAVLFPMVVRRRTRREGVDGMVPTGLGNFVEFVCAYFREQVARPLLHEHTDRFIKYIWSVFFFVLTLNLLGLLPIPAISGMFGAHYGGTATANIWITGTLAAATLVMMIVNGLRLGGVEYLKHFNPGPWWLAPLMVPIEIFGMLVKVFALMVRLFANMVAGHLILAVLLGFVFSAGAVSVAMGLGIAVPVVLGSVAMTMLEIFVAFLQAFIFTFLTTLFIGMSTVFHHEEQAAGVH